MEAEKERSRSRFEAEFRRWAGRPPATPPDQAARKLLHRIEPSPWRRPAHRLAAAAVTAVSFAVITAGVFLLTGNGNGTHQKPIITARSLQAAQQPAPPLDDNVVIQWLDPDTPVYFVLGSPESN